jgi:hypothetical protein
MTDLLTSLNRLGYDVRLEGSTFVSRHLGRLSEGEARKIVTAHGGSIGAAL